jgi:hypothetical protein
MSALAGIAISIAVTRPAWRQLDKADGRSTRRLQGSFLLVQSRG